VGKKMQNKNKKIEATMKGHVKIGVIYTGGTIGSLSVAGAPLSPMTMKIFSAAFLQLVVPAVLEVSPNTSMHLLPALQFSNGSAIQDSTEATPEDWCVLADQLLLFESSMDAFLVLHGTDTLEYTSAALSFLLCAIDDERGIDHPWSKPVIVTGSQIPLFVADESSEKESLIIQSSSDALDNIQGAVQSARSDLAGVYVYFGQQLLHGACVRKWHTHDKNAFATPNIAALNTKNVNSTAMANHALTQSFITKNTLNLATPDFERLIEQVVVIRQHLAKNSVWPIKAVPMMPRSLIHPLAELINVLISEPIAARALILESFGSGNFPSGCADQPELGVVYQALLTAIDNGVLVIDCSQVPSGSVALSTYASGEWLARIGVQSADAMTPSCAYVKVVLLLAMAAGKGWNHSKILKLFVQDWCGEFSRA
jgi:L-asparaginase